MHTLLRTFTIIGLSSLLLFSCTNDEDTALVINSENIAGEWELVSMDMDMSISAVFSGLNVNADMTADISTADYTVTFSEDSWTTNGGYTYDYSLEVASQSPITGAKSIEDIDGSGAYTLDGSIITLSGAFFDLEIEGYSTTSASSVDQAAQLSFDAEGQLVMTQTLEEGTDMGSNVIVNEGGTIAVWKRK